MATCTHAIERTSTHFTTQQTRFNAHRILHRQSTCLGLPSKVWALGLGVSAVIFFLLSKCVGIFFLSFYYYQMAAMHRRDPIALDILFYRLRHPCIGWSAASLQYGARGPDLSFRDANHADGSICEVV